MAPVINKAKNISDASLLLAKYMAATDPMRNTTTLRKAIYLYFPCQLRVKESKF